MHVEFQQDRVIIILYGHTVVNMQPNILQWL